MSRALLRPGLLALCAAVAAVLEAGREVAECGRVDPPALARGLWPDPLDQADRAARCAAASGDGNPLAALRSAQAAASRSPRSSRIHLLAGKLARECGAVAEARTEMERAARCDPFHGEVQLAVAQDLLVDAVEQQDGARLDQAARAFAAAVQVAALDCRDAYVALAAASAPAGAFDLVAGADRQRLEALIEHHAGALDEAAALAVALRLDAMGGDPERRASALAERRLGAACFAAGRARDAIRHFERAAGLMADPDALALDRADAHLAAGEEPAGVALLLRAFLLGAADAERAAGSIASARAPGPAAAALFTLGCASQDAAVRTRLAEVFGRLGQATRQRELLAGGSGSRG